MILLDYSGIAIAAIMANTFNSKAPLDEDLIRHIILNSIRKYNVMFRNEYGHMALCCDSAYNWRKEIFKEYKGARKSAKDKSSVDWPFIYKVLDSTLLELKENFPFDVLSYPTMEADDIIGVISIYMKKRVMIVSGDHDFPDQLLVYPNVSVYSPKAKGVIKYTPEEARKNKLTHILRGCKGDGVPNILSDDDTFVNESKRQKQLRQTKIDAWLNMTEDEMINTFSEQVKINYFRNKAMVTFEHISKEKRGEIIQHVEDVINKRKPFSTMKLMTYFAKNNLKYLTSCASEFSCKDASNQTPLTLALGIST